MAAIPHRMTDPAGEDHRAERAFGGITIRKALTIGTGTTSLFFVLIGGLVAHESRYATKLEEQEREIRMTRVLHCGLADLRLGQLGFRQGQLRELLDQGKDRAANRLDLDQVEERMRQIRGRMDRDRCDVV